VAVREDRLAPTATSVRICSNLEEAGYVAVEKKSVSRKPQTIYRITDKGRKALTEYMQALKQLLGSAITA
jgi:DNA-binding PadR family transcriptional regulator